MGRGALGSDGCIGKAVECHGLESSWVPQSLRGAVGWGEPVAGLKGAGQSSAPRSSTQSPSLRLLSPIFCE